VYTCQGWHIFNTSLRERIEVFSPNLTEKEKRREERRGRGGMGLEDWFQKLKE